MPKVYSYKRFSHVAQATGDSIRRQKDKTQEWADKHGYVIDTELQLDDRGKSAFDGTNLRTGALGQFLTLAREGKIEKGSILAIEVFDRLTRAEPMDAFNLLNDLVQCGISVVTVSDGRLYDSKTLNRDLTALMMAAVMLVRGHEESRRKSEMLQGHYAKRRAEEASKIGHVPPGWLRPTANGWELVPEHAATVMEIFELAAKGIGATVIARRFNTEKRVVPSRRKSKGWYPSRVSKLLRAKSVIGEYQAFVMDGVKMIPVGPPIPNYYPAAITEELFWKVQSLLSQRAPKGRRTDGGYRNFLAGMLKCEYCGGTFTLDKKLARMKSANSSIHA
ncbi:Recombinase [Laribacter hongkongensis HLHK9]|uniref:Recombinase n=1 Tax=Laribacter hongkongensis (strain HLHK9) TaxID=557598 RepID=C1D595_LARHH|nr:recombinase family protein [Laribacter hongkongensis]ACO73912.1 Recombinase [Laribacter hongkongensis HLHK9]